MLFYFSFRMLLSQSPLVPDALHDSRKHTGEPNILPAQNITTLTGDWHGSVGQLKTSGHTSMHPPPPRTRRQWAVLECDHCDPIGVTENKLGGECIQQLDSLPPGGREKSFYTDFGAETADWAI